MNNEKLAEIGGKINITKEEIRKINKQHRKEKIRTILTGGMISMISLVTGYIVGKNREPKMEYRGYPYGISTYGSSFCCAIGLCVFGGLGSLFFLHKLYKKKHRTVMSFLIIIFICLSVMAVIFGHEVGRPVEYYSGAIEYGVYSKETGGANDE